MEKPGQAAASKGGRKDSGTSKKKAAKAGAQKTKPRTSRPKKSKAKITSLSDNPVWLAINVPNDFTVYGANFEGRTFWAIDAQGNVYKEISVETIDSGADEANVTAKALKGALPGSYRLAVGLTIKDKVHEDRYPDKITTLSDVNKQLEKKASGLPSGPIYGLFVI